MKWSAYEWLISLGDARYMDSGTARPYTDHYFLRGAAIGHTPSSSCQL
jgi:hypothetical protein